MKNRTQWLCPLPLLPQGLEDLGGEEGLFCEIMRPVQATIMTVSLLPFHSMKIFHVLSHFSPKTAL